MILINPYINFNGNTELSCSRKGCREDNTHLSACWQKYFDSNDVPDFMGRVNENENRSKIAVSTESKEEAEKIFNGLSVGSTVEMPKAQSPWGSYFTMFKGKYGIEWTIEFDPNKSRGVVDMLWG